MHLDLADIPSKCIGARLQCLLMRTIIEYGCGKPLIDLYHLKSGLCPGVVCDRVNLRVLKPQVGDVEHLDPNLAHTSPDGMQSGRQDAVEPVVDPHQCPLGVGH